MTHILAIDQGTTSSRGIIFDRDMRIVATAQQEFEQHFPQSGWVEHVVDDLWETTVATSKGAIEKAGISAADVTAIGITNQRETTIVWDKNTGQAIHNAIVWQDRRTSDMCRELKTDGFENTVTHKTGLLLDPYFSGTKLKWILDNVDGARVRAEAGELAFGTVDSFVLWHLTGGDVHATDITNASRTLIYNVVEQDWDEALLALFNIPANLLPEVKDSSDDFGTTEAYWLGAALPIAGVAGDQQAALVGQACFQPGMGKSTYGTGCFMILNTGDQPLKSEHKMLTTVGYRINGQVTYALEGSIFVAGAAIQWLRDGLKLFDDAAETQSLAERALNADTVYLVPAFTGLGAPYWDPDARGAMIGLTRDTSVSDIVSAGLRSVCYQTKDLVDAMAQDGAQFSTLRVDGGMVVNNLVVQFLSDVLGITVERPQVTETTALGVAFLAGLRVGMYESLEQISELWQSEQQFNPEMGQDNREKLYSGWLDAVSRVRSVQ